MSRRPRRVATDLREHPAVRAWARLSPGSAEPREVWVLKRKSRGAVYRLMGVGPRGGSVIAKHGAPEEIAVERTMYEAILPRLETPGVGCYGCVPEGEDGFVWLFLEDAGGVPYAPDLVEHRRVAARWLAGFHAAAPPDSVASRFPDRGVEHYRRVLRTLLAELPRVRELASLAPGAGRLLGCILALCRELEGSWDELERASADVPRTLVHGDCLPKNAHVRSTPTGPAFAPFDWGGVGLGLVATDLGTLALPHRGPPDHEPDYGAYLGVARTRWPQLDVRLLERLANLGQLFWALKVIHRCLPEFDCAWARPEDVLSDYRIYALALARSLGLLG